MTQGGVPVSNLEVTSDSREPAMDSDRKKLMAVRAFALIVLGALIARLLWIGDDALITLRTALNLAHGWGAGFNVTEAVQSYTHPLWFLAWTALGKVTGEWILTILALSFVLSIVAAAMVLWSARSIWLVVLSASSLALSNAFMEWTSSGLENPLAWVTVGGFTLLALRYANFQCSSLGFKQGLALGALLAATLLTRLDLLLILFPITVYLIWKFRSRLSFIAAGVIAAAMPMVIWFIWSWSTYKSILPNTFLAKQNLNIPKLEIAVQGFRYFWVSIDFDPVTAIVIIGSLLVLLIWGSAAYRLTACGVIIYLTYVFYIGGDFMAGRFISVPFFVLVLLLVKHLSTFSNQPFRKIERSEMSIAITIASILSVCTFVAVLGAAGRSPISLTAPSEHRWENSAMGHIYDTRGKFMTLGKGFGQLLMSLWEKTTVPPFLDTTTEALEPLRDVRSAANNWPDRDPNLMIRPTWPDADGQVTLLPSAVGTRCGLIGEAAILTGPTVHWVDGCALTDRFIASIPYESSNFQWLVGHYWRQLPEGYLEAVAKNDPSLISDPQMAAELEQLWRLIR